MPLKHWEAWGIDHLSRNLWQCLTSLSVKEMLPNIIWTSLLWLKYNTDLSHSSTVVLPAHMILLWTLFQVCQIQDERRMFSSWRSNFASVKEPQNLEWGNHWYQWRLGMERLRAVLPRLRTAVDEALCVCAGSPEKGSGLGQVQGRNSPLLCPLQTLGTNSRRMWSCWESRGGHRDGPKAAPLHCGDRLGDLGVLSQERRLQEHLVLILESSWPFCLIMSCNYKTYSLNTHVTVGFIFRAVGFKWLWDAVATSHNSQTNKKSTMNWTVIL